MNTIQINTGIILLSIFVLLFTACYQKKKINFESYSSESIQNEQVDSIVQEIGRVPFLDTVINVDNSISKIISKRVITEDAVKEALYEYYQKKEYCIEDKIPAGKPLEDGYLMCIKFDTAYLVNLNCDKNLDAIVEYWIIPPGGSSHCYLPQKAIMLNVNGKLLLKNKDFITDGYIVNKVEQKDDCSVVLYGVEWDCGDDKILRNFKVLLK